VVHAPLSDCSTCHTPPAAGQKLTKADPALCFDCHEDRKADLKKPVVHEAFKGTCVTCHTPHASAQKALLSSPEKELCGSCHDLGKELAGKSVHKPAAEGKCSACHAPHAGAVKKLLKAEGAALCAPCHEKAKTWGAKKNVHTPFKGGACLSCHVAHGGDNPKLAARPGAESCYACHEPQKKAFAKTFAHAPVREGQCAKCHDPHASDLPKYLLKPADKLCASCHEQTIARAPGEDGKSGTPHPPFAGGECATCHEPHATSRTRLLRDVASKLCEGCHADVIDKAVKAGKAAGGSVHQPVKAGTCESCHDAHGSRQKAYLTGAPRALCLKCHGPLEARLKKAKAVVHKPVAEGKCLDCHGGHSSTSPALLVKPVPAVCATCHDLKAADLVKKHGGFSLEKTNCSSCHDPHVSQKKGLFNPVFHPPFTDGDCASCHKATAAGTAPIAPAASLNAKGADLCTPCHGDFPERFKKAWTHAPAKSGDCVACHSPHASKEKHLVASPPVLLCTSCHESIAKDLAAKSVHPPVKDGSCAKCHDAHAGDLKKGLVKAGGDLCFPCHAPEKALLKARVQHAPFAKGDCGKCHDPHASNTAAQLRAPAAELCRKCHDLAAAKTAQAHKSFPMAGADCVSCHNPHASEQPGLVRNKPHAVLNTCARCHNVAGGKPRDLVAKTTDLCFRCHGSVRVAAQKPGAHKALQQGCVACHTPHAADARGLPKGSERENCLSCHSQKKQQAARSRSVHPLKVENGRCSICHAGHVSEFGALLKAAPENLCKDCHKSHSDFAHPFGPGVVDPRTGRTLTCLSCHDPHGTAYPAILVDNPQRALCVQCHKSEGPTLGTGHAGTKRGAPSGRPSP
jgi:predicted CXXCH cytochrome family protein